MSKRVNSLEELIAKYPNSSLRTYWERQIEKEKSNLPFKLNRAPVAERVYGEPLPEGWDG